MDGNVKGRREHFESRHRGSFRPRHVLRPARGPLLARSTTELRAFLSQEMRLLDGRLANGEPPERQAEYRSYLAAIEAELQQRDGRLFL
jgi:hypothetical protein